jgi:hypothetical protein
MSNVDHAEIVSHDKGHAFCETIAANLTHIRPLTAAGRKPSGGADTPALCGAKVLWDTATPFTSAKVASWNAWPYALCSRCKAAFLEPGEVGGHG